MGFLGKEIRINRLLNKRSHKLLAVAIDHSIARGIMKGLVPIQSTIDKIVEGGPEGIIMHKGIAEKCFYKHAGEVSLIIKCSTFSPYQPAYDTWVTDVEECVRLGADAVSMGCIVGGKDQPDQLRNLGLISKQAESYGMPLISHIYPRGELIQKDERYLAENVAYAARAAAELGVDIVKTCYTGSPETFRKVIDACPTMVAVAGGEMGNNVEDCLRRTRDIMDAGAVGVTYGRSIWQYEHIPELIKALKFIVHDNGSVKEAIELLKQLEGEC